MSWVVVLGRVRDIFLKLGLKQGILSKLSRVEVETGLLCLCNVYTDNYGIKI